MFWGGSRGVPLDSLVNHDVAWILWLAQQVSEGRQLYRDLLEVNPPLIVWLSIPVVRLAGYLHVSPYATYYGAAVLVLFGTSALAVRLLPSEPRRGAALAIGLALGPVAGADFGQREHLCVGLFLPLLALALRRRTGLPRVSSLTEVGCGLLAGIAIALKPYFAAMWLLIMAWRRWQLEDAAILATGVIYVVAVAVFAPDFLVLESSLLKTYLEFNRQSWFSMLIHPAGLSLVVLSWGWLTLRRRGVRDDAVDLWLLAAGGSWCSAVLQRKGWEYHWYPVIVFTILAFTAIYQATRRRQAISTAKGRRLLAYMGAAVALVCVGRAMTTFLTLQHRAEAIALMREVAKPGDRILVLSSRVADAWPSVVSSGAQWAGRVPSLWFAQRHGLRSPGSMDPGERLLYDATVSDARTSPELLVVETPILNAQRQGRTGFDALAYLAQDERFAATLAGYRVVRNTGGMTVWARR